MADTTPAFDDNACDLLRRTLEDPFGGPGSHVEEWFKLLRKQFPLWSFNSHAYHQQLHVVPNLPRTAQDPIHFPFAPPTTYPLQQFLDSVTRDEIGDEARRPVRLFYLLDRWRVGLGQLRQLVSSPLLPGSLEPLDADEGLLERTLFSPSNTGRPLTLEAEDLPGPAEPEGPDDEPIQGHYEELGRDLLQHVEAIAFAFDSEAREDAEKRRDEFLTHIRARMGKKGGRWEKYPGAEIIKPIYDEGVRLIELVWKVSGWPISSEARRTFDNLGVSARKKQRLWCLRLALPVLSFREAVYLVDAPDPDSDSGSVLFEFGGLKVKDFKPTSDGFVWLVLGHRLGVRAEKLVSRVRSSDAAAAFKTLHTNPITDQARPSND